MGSHLPNLLHPIPVEFQLQDSSNTIYDKYSREPVQQVTRKGENPRTGTSVIIKAQISFYFAGARLDEVTFGLRREGVVEESIGYLTLRYKDMFNKGLASYNKSTNAITMILQRGDRIVKLGKRPVEYYVVGFKDFAHYPRYHQTMIQVNFMDRHPGYLQGNL